MSPSIGIKEPEEFIKIQGGKLIYDDGKKIIIHEKENLDKGNSKLSPTINAANQAISDSPPPQDRDALNYIQYAEALSEFLINPKTVAPLNIGITGAWGSGKTTLMSWIKEMLDKEKINTVWFNAWKHSRKEQVWAAFFESIVTQLLQSRARKLQLWWLRIKENEVSTGFYIVTIFLVLFSLIAIVFSYIEPANNIIKNIIPSGIKGSLAGSSSLIGFFYLMFKLIQGVRSPLLKIASLGDNSNYSTQLGFQKEFEKDIDRLIRIVSKKHPVIIFIDDLDRSNPEDILTILEAMNLLINNKNCFFVLGLDPSMVSASIESAHHKTIEYLKNIGDEIAEKYGLNFIEKMIQISFNIPEPSKTEISHFTNSLLIDNYLKERKDKKMSGNTVPEARFVSEDSPSFVTAANSAIELISSNPRKIKKFINYFRLMTTIATKREITNSSEFNLQHFAVTISAATEHPGIYRKWKDNFATAIWEDIVAEAKDFIEDRLNKNKEYQTVIRLNEIERPKIYTQLTDLVDKDSAMNITFGKEKNTKNAQS